MKRYTFLFSLAIILPLLFCTCCTGVFFLPTFAPVMSELPLVVSGSQARASITAIQPCQSALVISATSTGFSYTTHDTAGVSVAARFTDAQGNEQTGVTAICTELPGNMQVGDTIAIWYRPDAPGSIVLYKDLATLRGFALLPVVLLICVVLAGALCWWALRRSLRAAPASASMGASMGGAMQSPGAEMAQRLQQLNAAAIGPGSYPTQHIGLKEALLLLQLRNPSPSMPDSLGQSGKFKQLHNHMIAAAMLLDLVLRRRIEIDGSGRIFARATVRVLDPSPVDDPDIERLLTFLRTAHSGRADLRGVYMAYASEPLVARLVDQLRRGGYVRVHEPTTGRYAQERPLPRNPLLLGIATWAGKLGLEGGTTVLSDDGTRALPWWLLYTTQKPEEEAMFARVRAAISMHTATDEFTQALLLLVAALYVPRVYFGWQRLRTSIYGFYERDEQKALTAFLRRSTREAPASWQTIYRLAKSTDERIENPPDAG